MFYMNIRKNWKFVYTYREGNIAINMLVNFALNLNSEYKLADGRRNSSIQSQVLASVLIEKCVIVWHEIMVTSKNK